MNHYSLAGNQKNVLRQASSLGIQNTLYHLKGTFLRNKWLVNNNRYRKDTVNRIEVDLQSPPLSLLSSKHLSEYIAVSALLHCVDGWDLLGRAINAHLSRDRDAARHLSYYAELRAAMSLLACEGVGIFLSKHFIVDSAEACIKIPNPQHQRRDPNRKNANGTHVFTWLCLEHWDDLEKSSKLIGEVISPANIPLMEWHNYFAPGSRNMIFISTDWLRTWGLDLSRLGQDREARNESSYRPTKLNSIPPLDLATVTKFTMNMWKVCEPSGTTGFEYLDKHLLRISLEKAFLASSKRTAQADPAGFAVRIESMLNTMPISNVAQVSWKSFLTRSIEKEDPLIIQEAQGNVSIDNSRHHIQVLSRSILLLRLAQGASRRLINEANITKADLLFWWKSLGEERGIWEAGNEPAYFTDLWADVGDALNDLETWEVANSGPGKTFFRWQKECAPALSTLSECERIALWGLGI